MTTMARRLTIGVWGLVGVLMLTGCGPGPKDLQIQALQEQLGMCQLENDDLISGLATAAAERNAAHARVLALEQQVYALRRELAETPVEPAGPEGWVHAGPFNWIDVGSDLLFGSGKASLRPEGRAKLQQIVQQINETFPTKMIWVLGHTDAEPIKATKNLYKDNLYLSLVRGATVFRELQKLGIPPRRMIAGGQGEYNPKGPGDARGRSKANRRVQILAVPMPPTAGD